MKSVTIAGSVPMTFSIDGTKESGLFHTLVRLASPVLGCMFFKELEGLLNTSSYLHIGITSAIIVPVKPLIFIGNSIANEKSKYGMIYY